MTDHPIIRWNGPDDRIAEIMTGIAEQLERIADRLHSMDDNCSCRDCR